MSLLDPITKVVSAVIPDMDASPQHQLRWRMSIAMLLLGSVSVQAVHVLIACGWLAGYGISGFAYANDVNQLIQAQQRMEVRQVEKNLMDLDSALCKAEAAGKATRYIAEQIRAGITEYRALSGLEWVRPTCAELGE
jgi:hypothetical protein